MPAEVMKELLDRDLAVVSAKPVTEPACALLREVINDATRVHRRCESDAKRLVDEEDVHLAPFTLYYHIISLADASEELLSRSCVDPTIPLVRSMFESVLQLNYIVKDRATYRERCLHWNVCYLWARVRAKEAFVPNTRRGQRFRRVSQNDSALKNFVIPSYAVSLKDDVKGLRNLLRTKRFASITKEYNRRKVKRRRKGKSFELTPYAFSLFGGPSNFRALSRELGVEGFYVYLYDSWSSFTHGGDASRYITTGENDSTAFYSLRNAEHTPEQAEWVYVLLIWSRRIMLDCFRPNEPKPQDWFDTDVKPLRDRLDGIRLNNRRQKLANLSVKRKK